MQQQKMAEEMATVSSNDQESTSSTFLERHIAATVEEWSVPFGDPITIDLYAILEAKLLTALGLSKFIGSESSESGKRGSTTRKRASSGEEKNSKRRRTAKREESAFTTHNKGILERFFEQTENPTRQEKENMAGQTGLSDAQITKWFQNRRYRKRLAERN